MGPFDDLMNPEMEDDNIEELLDSDPETLLDDPTTPYEVKLQAMQRIKDRYLKPREE